MGHVKRRLGMQPSLSNLQSYKCLDLEAKRLDISAISRDSGLGGGGAEGPQIILEKIIFKLKNYSFTAFIAM